MSVQQLPDLVPETRFGSPLIDVSVDFPADTAAWFNARAAAAGDKVPGEWVELTPGRHLALAFPTEHVDREGFLELHDRLQLRIDDEIVFDLKDHPRFFSFAPSDFSRYRHGPVWIRHDLFPEGFLGNYHRLEVLSQGRSLWGPERRFFMSPSSGTVYESVEGGKGKMVAKVRNLTQLNAQREKGLPTWIAVFTDPAFGVPTGGTLIDASGERHPLRYELVGTDYVGDTMLFNEAVLWGIEAHGDEVTIEVDLPNTGTGLGVMLASGHSLPAAVRSDITVS